MLTDTLRKLFARDLSRLQHELQQYQNEHTIWHFEKGIANSAGNLCLHLVGNLKTYIGVELGGVAYTRNRDLEFSLKNVPRVALLDSLRETSMVVDTALASLPETELQKEYPLLVFEEKTSTEYFLVHLAAHLAYHLGQVNYHRRLLDV
ncbi:DinB family protein [Hymenobacter tibetensis]|uniref:DinB family protein n=1 Tax=Hymenobacter tibetensis TaxID=497967 RepID=A0ABY4D3Z4_9BACT|nr:DUF1572 family protein [Hymenobacter tibetensis]UOG77238.1 DinB family protein [Hymenobacter tibetensis]